MRASSSLGQKFGMLLVLGQWPFKGRTRVLAQCNCGKLKEYQLGHLKSGATQSCGCIMQEVCRKNGTKRKTHGKSRTRIYYVWDHMLRRCNNSTHKAYKSYGGRGIKVCERWLKFENFYTDMGDKPQDLELDRRDNDKGYFKENCHWTTRNENLQNKRNSKWWFVNNKRYDSSCEAGKAIGVSSTAIVHWCEGWHRSRDGVRTRYPSKPGCYSELKYNIQEAV